MNIRTLLLLVVALGAAGLTAFYARNWISAERAAMQANLPQQEVQAPAVMVLVAETDLAPGTFVRQKDHLKWQPWPEDGVIDAYFVQGEREPKNMEGAVVRTAIAAGQPITNKLVVHPGERGFLAAVLEPGTRAVSVPVNATSGIAGFVFPGDAVDVILTFRMNIKESEKGETETRYFSETLLTDVRVLAIDQAVENQDGAARVAKTATLEVDAQEAEKIAIGMEIGSLSLSLRALAREEQDQEPAADAHLANGAAPIQPQAQVLPASAPAEPLKIEMAAGAPRALTKGGVRPDHKTTEPQAPKPETNGREADRQDEEQPNPKTYTADLDVYYMLNKPRGFTRGGRKDGPSVHVMHGNTAEEVKY